LAEVPRWEGNRIPTLNEAIVLTPESQRKIEVNTPFKLDPRSKDLIRGSVDFRKLQVQTRSCENQK
jgi:hypothetical protein